MLSSVLAVRVSLCSSALSLCCIFVTGFDVFEQVSLTLFRRTRVCLCCFVLCADSSAGFPVDVLSLCVDVCVSVLSNYSVFINCYFHHSVSVGLFLRRSSTPLKTVSTNTALPATPLFHTLVHTHIQIQTHTHMPHYLVSCSFADLLSHTTSHLSAYVERYFIYHFHVPLPSPFV